MFLALGPATAERHEVGNLGIGNFVVTTREWSADDAPVAAIDVPEDEAPMYREAHKNPVVEVAFRIGRVRIDRRQAAVRNRVTNERVRLDVGAGPLMEAEIVAVRVKDESGNVMLDTTPAAALEE